MEYKEYGKTGKKISVIGFGGMRFRKDGDCYDYDKCAQVIHTASEKGVNYFDTAPFYCDDESEKIFGYALADMPKPYYISTKSGETDGDKLRRQLERSLKRLKLSKVHFFHIWCVMNMDDYRSRMVKGGAYETAMRAKEEGLIEHVVFSTHCNGDEIAAIVEEGAFEGMTVGYNILNFPFRQKGLQAAHAHGLGIATMNPLGGGIIPQRAEYFDFLRAGREESAVQAALRFNASHKEITTALAGMSSLAEVEENTSLAEPVEELTDEALESIRSRLSASMDSLCTGCRYCEHCPQEIEVSKYMQAYNSSILGKPQDALNTVKYHWHIPVEKMRACISCGLCEAKCTQHLPIIRRMQEMLEWHGAQQDK